MARRIATSDVNFTKVHKEKGTVKGVRKPGFGDITLREIDDILALKASGKKMTREALEWLVL